MKVQLLFFRNLFFIIYFCSNLPCIVSFKVVKHVFCLNKHLCNHLLFHCPQPSMILRAWSYENVELFIYLFIFFGMELLLYALAKLISCFVIFVLTLMDVGPSVLSLIIGSKETMYKMGFSSQGCTSCIQWNEGQALLLSPSFQSCVKSEILSANTMLILCCCLVLCCSNLKFLV